MKNKFTLKAIPKNSTPLLGIAGNECYSRGGGVAVAWSKARLIAVIMVLFLCVMVLPSTASVSAETYTDGQIVTLGDWELSYNRKWDSSSWVANATNGFGARCTATSGDVTLPQTDLVITNMDYALRGKTLNSVGGVIPDTVASMQCFLYNSTVCFR